MDTKEISPSLKKELLPGEEILWRGSTEKRAVKNPDTEKKLITRWIVCAVIYVGTLIAYTSVLKGGEVEFNWAVAGAFTLLLGFICAEPFLTAKKVIRKFSYYVTDRRVIVDGAELQLLNRAGLKMRIHDHGDGCETWLFGSSVDLKPSEFPDAPITPGRSDDNSIIGSTFYHIKKDKALNKLFF